MPPLFSGNAQRLLAGQGSAVSRRRTPRPRWGDGLRSDADRSAGVLIYLHQEFISAPQKLQVMGVLISSFLYDFVLFPIFARAERNKPMMVMDNIDNDYIALKVTLGLKRFFFLRLKHGFPNWLA